MTKRIAVAVIAAAVLIGGRASAEVVWRGDYESGDLSQWSRAQSVAADRLQIVGEPVAQGNFAMRASVNQGDNPIGASGNRNELAYMSLEPSGSERYYRWQTLFPGDYPSADRWQLFTQFHHSGPNGSPPVQFYVRGEQIILAVNNVEVWAMPLQRGRWIDFIFHAKWSSDPAVGFAELSVDGQLVLPKLMTATQFPGEVNYLKQGLYRDASIAPSASVFHDGMVIGTALADVQGSLASGLEAGAPQAAYAGAADGVGATGGGGCSTGAGAPLLGAAFALVAMLRRRAARR